MAEYYDVKFKLSDSQLVKLNSSIKNATGVTPILSSGMIGADKNNVPHNFPLTNRQVSGLSKSFASSPSKDINYQRLNYPK